MDDKLRRLKARRTIKVHLHAALLGGFIPTPGMGVALVLGAQLSLINQLCRIYEVEFKKNAVKGSLISLLGSIVPYSMSNGTLASLIGLIPIVGSGLGFATMSIFSGAATYAVGQVYVRHFETGGNLLNFDPEAMKEYFKEMMEEGKKEVKATA